MEILKFYSIAFIILLIAGSFYLAGYKKELAYFISVIFYIPILIYLFLS